MSQHIRQKIVVLGSTGSLGRQILDVIARDFDHKIEIIGLSGHKNQKLLHKQACKFRISSKNAILSAPRKISELCALPEIDAVVNVISGIAGIKPSIDALIASKILITANKEALVAKGQKIMEIAEATKITSKKTQSQKSAITKNPLPERLIPLDSEHNAIFEILKKFPTKKIKKIIIPCSGGPFWQKPRHELANITPQEAIRHPRWKMGAKISVESATLINKGFEVIEAHYLFGLPLEKIEVVIHPECQIHGLVQFADELLPYGYFAEPDMREHIENCLHALLGVHTCRHIRILSEQEFQKLIPFNYLENSSTSFVLKFLDPKIDKIRLLEKEESLIAAFLEGRISLTGVRI